MEVPHFAAFPLPLRKDNTLKDQMQALFLLAMFAKSA